MRQPEKKPLPSRLRAFLRLWGLGLVLVGMAILVTTWGVQQLRDPQVLPVRVVGVDGEIRYLHRSRLQEAVIEAVKGSFFSVDLAKVRAEVERLPWVDKVTIRRVWPDTLKVRVEEQRPLARWGKDALLNPRGEIFRPQPLPEFPQLALLEGVEQDAVSISREYQRINILLGTVGLELARVRVDARQAWLLFARNGLELDLGRKETISRLTRFVRLYPGLNNANQARLKKVDLRYTNGFTASWEALPELQTNRDNPTEAGNASRLAGI